MTATVEAMALPDGPLGEHWQRAMQHWRERQAAREQQAWCAWLESADGQAWLEEQADLQDRRRAGIYS